MFLTRLIPLILPMILLGFLTSYASDICVCDRAISSSLQVVAPLDKSIHVRYKRDSQSRSSHGISDRSSIGSSPVNQTMASPQTSLQVDFDKLRLEYYKFKILSQLELNVNPDLLAPKFTDNNTLKQTIKELQQTFLHHKNNNSSSRQKRSPLACSQTKSDKDSCCLESFYVNFTEIGWDRWILYPSGYYANYCRGQCDLSNARYYHSTLLSKFSSFIGLCCSPRQMGPLRLLYIDDQNKVLSKTMPNMVVEKCDCA